MTSACSGLDFQFDFDARAEAVDDPDQTIERETRKVSVTDAREVRRRNASESMRRSYRQAIAIESLDDLCREQRFELLHVGVVLAEVAIDISTAADDFERFVLHHNISFNRFTRAAIKSISCFGVLIP